MTKFDLSKFTLADTATLEVLDVDGESPLLGENDKPVSIDLHGPGSEVYVKAQARLDQQVQQIGMQSAMAMQRGKAPKDTAVEMRKANVERLAACTKQINNFPVAPSDVYGNPGLIYITRQVERFLGDMGNFSRRSGKT